MAQSTKERLVYHVVPNSSAERWVVSQENAEFRKEFDTKEEAVEFAKERARAAELGQVKVHKKDGNMEYESTYGEDPRRSPS
ncbi:MAG TPA: DUF2188 domain-containing protein [Thermoanaerobaculia bacterium]|jgi:hypothetical protein|nr:DUF2188 domain-containing protein [Thermoanaerobaculia bacterium]